MQNEGWGVWLPDSQTEGQTNNGGCRDAFAIENQWISIHPKTQYMSKQKYIWFRIKVKVKGDSKQMQQWHICYPTVCVSGASLMWKQSNIYSMKSTFAELGSVLPATRHNFTCFGRLLRYIFLFYSVRMYSFWTLSTSVIKTNNL